MHLNLKFNYGLKNIPLCDTWRVFLISLYFLSAQNNDASPMWPLRLPRNPLYLQFAEQERSHQIMSLGTNHFGGCSCAYFCEGYSKKTVVCDFANGCPRHDKTPQCPYEGVHEQARWDEGPRNPLETKICEDKGQNPVSVERALIKEHAREAALNQPAPTRHILGWRSKTLRHYDYRRGVKDKKETTEEIREQGS